MNNPRLRALQALVALRTRRAQTLQQAVADASARVEQARRAADAAAERAAQCREAFLQSEKALQALMRSTFTLMDQRALALQGQDLLRQADQADKAAAQAHAAVEPLEQALQTAQQEMRRNAQRIDYFKERSAEIMRDQARDQAAAEDDEAGEVAAARLSARQGQALSGEAA